MQQSDSLTLDDLPEEIVVHIICFLDQMRDVCAVRLVSSKFQRLANDDLVYRSLIVARFGFSRLLEAEEDWGMDSAAVTRRWDIFQGKWRARFIALAIDEQWKKRSYFFGCTRDLKIGAQNPPSHYGLADPDGNRVAFLCDNRLYIAELQRAKVTTFVAPTKHQVKSQLEKACLASDPFTSIAAHGCYTASNCSITLWNISVTHPAASPQFLHAINLNSSVPEEVAVRLNSLAVAFANHELHVYDITTGQRTAAIGSLDTPHTNILLHHNSTLLAATKLIAQGRRTDVSVVLFDVRSSQPAATLLLPACHTERGSPVVKWVDDDRIAVLDTDGVTIIKTDFRQHHSVSLYTVKPHETRARCIQFTTDNDGERIALTLWGRQDRYLGYQGLEVVRLASDTERQNLLVSTGVDPMESLSNRWPSIILSRRRVISVSSSAITVWCCKKRSE